MKYVKVYLVTRALFFVRCFAYLSCSHGVYFNKNSIFVGNLTHKI